MYRAGFKDIAMNRQGQQVRDIARRLVEADCVTQVSIRDPEEKRRWLTFPINQSGQVNPDIVFDTLGALFRLYGEEHQYDVAMYEPLNLTIYPSRHPSGYLGDNIKAEDFIALVRNGKTQLDSDYAILKEKYEALESSDRELFEEFKTGTAGRGFDKPQAQAIEHEFLRFYLGSSYPNEVLKRLHIFHGLPFTLIRSVFYDFLMTGKSEEVVERRSLTREFTLPSPKDPRIKMLSPLTAADREISAVLKDLAAIQITDDCFRNCGHCSSGHNVTGMPYARLYQFLAAAPKLVKRPYLIKGDLHLYHATEILDAWDPVFGAHAGNMIETILNFFPEQKFFLNTRGGFIGETAAHDAEIKIGGLIEKHPDQIIARMSLDLYNTLGDPTRYIARMIPVISALGKNGYLRVNEKYHQDNRRATGYVYKTLESLFPDIELHEESGFISRQGRAARFDTLYDDDIFAFVFGKYLFPDGRIMQKVRKNGEGAIKHKFEPAPFSLWPKDEAVQLKDFLPVRLVTRESGIILDLNGSNLAR
ncbi:MAG: hypothetical protein AABZ57_06575 [Candidatus Margulisiibacteriota bacterium]